MDYTLHLELPDRNEPPGARHFMPDHKESTRMGDSIAVVAWGTNRLDIFGVGPDRAMYHKAWDGNQWLPSPTDWERLGGGFNGDPAVASWGANRLDIFGVGPDNAMYHKAWDGNQWLPSPTDWEGLGGGFIIP
jgi:hypothetical protein